MVTKMTPTASASLQPNQFNDFLFAPIGEERNGMSLTVLSALARLDLDPWLEADDLARMPKKAAADRMSALLSGLPERTLRYADADAIAGRLIALLPIENKPKGAPRAASRRIGRPIDSRVLVFAMLMAALLSAQLLMRPHPSEEPAARGASTSDRVSQPNVGR
jgi:hypothetical protein